MGKSLIYTLVRVSGDIHCVLLNGYGFPYKFEKEEDAILERIEQQQIYDEPVIIKEVA
jgi:hypothetical protein